MVEAKYSRAPVSLDVTWRCLGGTNTQKWHCLFPKMTFLDIGLVARVSRHVDITSYSCTVTYVNSITVRQIKSSWSAWQAVVSIQTTLYCCYNYWLSTVMIVLQHDTNYHDALIVQRTITSLILTSTVCSQYYYLETFIKCHASWLKTCSKALTT